MKNMSNERMQEVFTLVKDINDFVNAEKKNLPYNINVIDELQRARDRILELTDFNYDSLSDDEDLIEDINRSIDRLIDFLCRCNTPIVTTLVDYYGFKDNHSNSTYCNSNCSSSSSNSFNEQKRKRRKN